MNHCLGPVRGEYGVYCRWGIDQNETPDCVACEAAAAQAELDGADYYSELDIERYLEMERFSG